MGILHRDTPEEKQKKIDEKFMKLALKEADKAFQHHEVPIGCVIVRNNKVLSKERNRRNTMKSAIAHAEVIAISEACKKINDWRLEDCTLYVTLEPCQMCTGAILQARIPRVVIGCMNPKAGCAGSVINLLQMDAFMHQADITYGVLEEECSSMLSDFFRDLREFRKDNPSDYRHNQSQASASNQDDDSEDDSDDELPDDYDDDSNDKFIDDSVNKLADNSEDNFDDDSFDDLIGDPDNSLNNRNK
jgi:tRNA(adenine34) deaminase